MPEWPTVSATTRTPAAAIRGPPTPVSRTSGESRRSASASDAPNRSPECSPAAMKMRG